MSPKIGISKYSEVLNAINALLLLEIYLNGVIREMLRWIGVFELLRLENKFRLTSKLKTF